MIPLPCNPASISVGYGVRDGEKVIPLTALVPREAPLPSVPNACRCRLPTPTPPNGWAAAHHPLPPKGRGLGWFFAISGAIVLLLTLGCILAVTDGNLVSDYGGIAIPCGSPTLILGGVFLWLGSRRLKR